MIKPSNAFDVKGGVVFSVPLKYPVKTTPSVVLIDLLIETTFEQLKLLEVINSCALISVYKNSINKIIKLFLIMALNL